MSFGGRLAVVLCRLGVGSFRPQKIQTYAPPCFTQFHPSEKLFSAPTSPNPYLPQFGHRKSEVPLSANFQFALFNSQFSILAPSPKISPPHTKLNPSCPNRPQAAKI